MSLQNSVVLIEDGEVYAPEPCGRQSLLLVNDRILQMGNIDREALERLGCEVEVVDASGCLVVPGLIDPHEHLLGGSGESGFATQTPEISLHEIVRWGITTVVGCLGVDTTMKTLPGLLAKAKALNEEGMTAHVWTGGYNVPPTTLLGYVREDIMFISEIIGAGEIAISDERATDPAPRELARLVSDAHIGGMLSQKSGVTHFHVGDAPLRLTCIREILDQSRFTVEAEWIYVTHVERNEELLLEAVELARRGVTMDMDTVDGEVTRWIQFYREHGGPMDRLTLSSDASVSGPGNLFKALRHAVLEHGMSLEEILPLVTSNTASVLKLERKGRLRPGADADVAVLHRDTLDIEHVIARGRCMVRGGELAVRERFLQESNREIELVGDKSEQDEAQEARTVG